MKPNYFFLTKEELEKSKEIEKPKKYIDCVVCKKKHRVFYPQKNTGFYKCNEQIYLCVVDGKDVQKKTRFRS